MSLALLAPTRTAARPLAALRAERRRDRAERRALRLVLQEAASRCQCTGCRIDRAR